MILVTGATGFLGTYLINYFEEKQIPYLGISKSGSQINSKILKMDLQNIENVKVLQNYSITTVIHLASLIPSKSSNSNGVDFFCVNTMGTLNLLNCLKMNAIKKFIFATTLFEVIEHTDLPITEEMGLNYSFEGDHAFYVHSKMAATNILKTASIENGFHLTILRFTGLLGLGRQEGHWSNNKFYKSAFETFYENATNGNKIEIWGKGNIRRDSLYVKDAVSAILSSLTTSINNLETFNIASGIPSTVLEEVETFKRVFPATEFIFREELPTSNKEYFFDISKARRILKWQPKFNFEQTIRDYHLMRNIAGQIT